MSGTTEKRCARCGGHTQSRVVEGIQVDFCVDCGAVTMDRGDLAVIAQDGTSSSASTQPQDLPQIAGKAEQTFVLDDLEPSPPEPISGSRRRSRRRLLSGGTSSTLGNTGSIKPAGLSVGAFDGLPEPDTDERPTELGAPLGELPPPSDEGPATPQQEPWSAPPAAPPPPAPSSISREDTVEVLPPPPLPPPVSASVSGRTVKPRDPSPPWSTPEEVSDGPSLGSLGQVEADGPGLPSTDEWQIGADAGPAFYDSEVTEELVDDQTEESFFSGKATEETTETHDVRDDLDDEPLAPRRGRSPWLLAVVAVVALAAVGIVAVGVVFSMGLLGSDAIEPMAPATPDAPPAEQQVAAASPEVQTAVEVETDAPSPPAPEPEPEPEPAPAPEPEPAPAPEPQPTPVAAPAPAPAPKSSPGALVDQGWAKLDAGDTSGAGRSFQSALDLSPGHADANFGYGYVLLQQGDTAGARPFLCAALPGGDVELQREARGLLERNGLSCD